MQYHLGRSPLEWSIVCTSLWPTITSFSTDHILISSFPYRRVELSRILWTMKLKCVVSNDRCGHSTPDWLHQVQVLKICWQCIPWQHSQAVPLDTKMTPPPPCHSALWSVPAPETEVVWQEGPLLVCHSTIIQYLVVQNCKPKKSLQNFTSLFNLVVTISQCCNLQQTCKPWKNSKALNLLWNITTTQHKKNTTKRCQIQPKEKRTEKWLPLNSQITQHCTSWGNNRAPY